MTHVHILMATFNGATFLNDQLNSFLAQTHQNWSLWVSDDRSCDETLAIMNQFCRDHPKRAVAIMRGPGQGVFANFMHLLRNPDLQSGYVAFSDQDDVWLPHHLEAALHALSPCPDEALYCATRIPTDADLHPLNEGPPPPLPATSFHNALLQNVVAGNTIVMNPAATQLLQNDPVPSTDIPYHDWWIYLRLSAAGARLICDPYPSLFYRQHENNMVGDRKSGRLRRFQGLFDGTYGNWLTANLKALLALPTNTLRPDHRRDVATLLNQRPRLRALRQSNAYRSDFAGRMSLPVAALLGRL